MAGVVPPRFAPPVRAYTDATQCTDEIHNTDATQVYYVMQSSLRYASSSHAGPWKPTISQVQLLAPLPCDECCVCIALPFKLSVLWHPRYNSSHWFWYSHGGSFDCVCVCAMFHVILRIRNEYHNLKSVRYVSLRGHITPRTDNRFPLNHLDFSGQG